MSFSFHINTENHLKSFAASKLLALPNSQKPLSQEQNSVPPVEKEKSVISFQAGEKEELKQTGIKNWNIGDVVTPLGILATAQWGVSSILEHKVQTHPEQYLKKPGSIALAKYTPIFSVLYGTLNAIGAFAQGYAIRTIAFASFTLASIIAAPFILKDTRIAIKIAEAIKDGQAKAFIQELAKKGEKLRNITTLYNAVAPVGLLVGLFTMTKVAQSTPGVTLEHPHGTSLNDILFKAEKGQDVLSIIKRNIRTEIKSFNAMLLNTIDVVSGSIKDYKQAFKNLFSPREEDKKKSAMQRFQDPIVKGHSVPWFYAIAGAGRTLASATAIIISLKSIQTLKKPSIYTKFSGEAIKATPTVKTLNNSMKNTLFVGQVAGAFSALLTIFSDWPVWLSTVYKASGLCYGASAIMAKFPKLAKKIDIGLDEYALTKLGAFIQGSSYLVNLFVKKYTHKPDKSLEELPVAQK